ncbi:unnamed protein product [Heligmosomoides polygyrus]|uniref:SGNH_hydro domain-containing protein n=1 Tax=Heligmosomoides polygyrus TaxID=6339 RepID=A0A183G3R7_HELPZ|nr:unnamed protein product [Heligmosomoides polygyrus]
MSTASQLKFAISSVKEVHGDAHTLNEDIRELLEQIDMVEKLPESTNLSRIEGWRSRLLAKMRMKISQNEDKYRHVVDVKWAKILATFKRDGPKSSSISYSFDNDLKLVQEFFDEVGISEKSEFWHFLMVSEMYRIPSLDVNESSMNIDPVLRLIKNKKESTLTAFPYDSRFVKALLKDVHVMAIGDSLMRSIYKDLIVMLNGDDLIEEEALRAKTETSFLGDRQIDILPLENDRVFRQAREYHTNYNLIQYLFTTRVMKNDIDVALLELWSAKEFPDVLLINSCLWDITRYSRAFDPDVPSYVNRQAGVERAAIEEFLERISMLIRRLRLVMPPTTQVIWINMPWPLTVDGRSIVNRADNAETRHLNRMLIVDANFRASQLFRAAGYDVLDIGFYMRNHALYSYRIKDGVHWDSVGTRIMTQLIIGHLARSWNITLPLRIKQKIAN